MSDPVASTGPADWERLDTKSLLTGPSKAVRQFGLPIAVAVLGVGSSGGLRSALMIFIGAIVVISVFGAIPWFTTSYRVTKTHLEVRSGLLNRKTLTARLDRVRSVDLESPLIHQALGIVRVKVGTGVDEGQIELDSLAGTTAEQLRTRLLHGSHPGEDEAVAPAPNTELAALDWSWLRFAPLNLVNAAVVIGALVALATQTGEIIGSAVERGADEALQRLGVLLLALVVVVAATAMWVVFSCLGYALRWFNLRVTREEGKDGTTLHQQAGLLTTRSTTVEEAKVRGVRMRRQLLIAAAGGAELSLLTIGLEDNSPAVLPAAPMATVAAVGHEVLREDAALTIPVVSHGRVVLWRYLRRALWWTLAASALLLAGGVLAVLDDAEWLPWWASVALGVLVALVGVSIALLSYRNLGHELTPHYLISQTGALTRDRTVLETDGIVGWRIKQSFFDRRLGLAQLSATTAAGDEVVVVKDVPLERAVELTLSATPHIVGEFVA